MLTPPWAGASSTVQPESFENMLNAATAIRGVDVILTKLADASDMDEMLDVEIVDPFGMAAFMRGVHAIPGPYFCVVSDLFRKVGITFNPVCTIVFFVGVANVQDIQKMLQSCQAYGKQVLRNGTILQREGHAPISA
jgi:hypothetical protein